MKKLFALLGAALCALVLFCQSLLAAEPMVTQIRVLDHSFHKLSVSSGIRLELASGKQYVEVKTFERLQDDVETFVKEGTLVVRMAPSRRPRVIRGGDIVVKVATSSLSAVSVSGGATVHTTDNFRLHDDARIAVSGGGRISGNLICDDDLTIVASGGGVVRSERIEADEMTLSASGGGRIDAAIRCGDVRLSASGGGRMVLSGRCEDISASVSGGGRAACEELIAEDVVVSASGGGSGSFTATGEARGSKSGGGSYTIRRR